MLYITYLFLVACMVSLSLFLSKYVDALDKKTNLSGAFIGGVLLAAVTSLPEFITSLTAVFLLDEPSLVQGNVLGSNVFNLAVIGACIFIFSTKFKKSKLAKSHMLTSIFTIVMFLLVFLGMKFQNTINLWITEVNLVSILVIVLYVINIKKMNTDDTGSTENTEDTLDLTVKQISFRFAICTVLLVIFSILLTDVADKVNVRLNLGATVGGAIFLGIATSLPELVSSVNLVRLGNFNASFGNIIGSNLFNFTILSFADFFYSKGNIYAKDAGADNLIFWGILGTLLVVGTLYAKKNKILSMILGVLIVLCYVASIVFSM